MEDFPGDLGRGPQGHHFPFVADDGAEVAATAPGSGPTGIGSVTFAQLGSYTVEQAGDDITVKGTVNNVEWPEFSSDEGERTGYYVAMNMTGTSGAYIAAYTPKNVRKVVALADCEDGYIKAVNKGQKSFTFTAYPSQQKAEDNEGGTKYRVDLSGVEYLEA